MADKKPSKPASGDRPMRRGAAKSDDARGKTRKPGDDKPRDAKGFKGAKGFKPEFKSRAEAKPARAPRKTADAPARDKAFEGDRIAKVMARAGVCSRRDAEAWIEAGRIALNGRVLSSPAVNVGENDKITIDGAPMQERERTRLFLFHKPAGYVTTAHDPEGRETVFDFLDARHAELPRLITVGRLDINTEGLLLLTNDGGLARTLELPATGWTRRYRVRVHGAIDQARLDTLRKGVTVDDVVYAPIEAFLERVQGANAWIAMSLTEGKNREIKRVMEYLGLDVTRLIRVSYGPFQLGDLAEGAVEEVRLKVLRDQLGKSLAELAGVDFSSPLREPTATEKQEMRERADKRSRKHVTVLRRQRDEKNATGPRARVERSATADRKGRAVVVERVAPSRRVREDAAPPSRNARRFDAMREDGQRPARDGARTRAPRREASGEGRSGTYERARPPRDAGAYENRPSRGPRQDRAKSFDAPRDGGSYQKRPPRDAGETRFERPPRNADGAGTRAPRQERTRDFDAPRNSRGAGPSKGPRSGAGAGRSGPPRGKADGGPNRSGPGRGGPGKGPNRGPGKGPRKPRGA